MSNENEELVKLFNAHCDSFASDSEGLTLSPEMWNTLRAGLCQAAAALSRSASGPSEEEIKLAELFCNDKVSAAGTLARAVLRMAGKESKDG